MVVEEFPDFLVWLGPALGTFLLIVVAGVVLGVFVGYLVATVRHGPFEAFYVVAQVISASIPDFLKTSPRRVWAIARLAIKEALRRRVILAAFTIFALALLFGGWFLSGADHPERIYISFVLWGTQLLVLLLALLLSAFSLPEDIYNKTIQTVVTKPVRPTEILLGRIVGFGALGTGLLIVMAVISLAFVARGLTHTHRVEGPTQTLADFNEVERETMMSRGRKVSPNAVFETDTTIDFDHRHRIEVIEDVRGADQSPPGNMENVIRIDRTPDTVTYYRVVVTPEGGHTHSVRVVGEGDEARIEIGPPVGYFRARIPVYASRLYFYDRFGEMTERGVSVGKEWDYRGFIDGGTAMTPFSLSRAVFEYDNMRPEMFAGHGDVIPLELTLSIFRTHMGIRTIRVHASIQFESIPEDPDDNRFQSDPIVFETQEFQIQTLPVPRTLPGRLIDPDGNQLDEGDYDLFAHYAGAQPGGQGGRLRLILRCEDRGQYVGVARADVYFLSGDDLYWANFFKGFAGIWFQMMIVIAFGVALSTFLNAPVTMLGVIAVIVLGFATPFVRTMAENVGDEEMQNNGPIESMVRLVTQTNMEVDFEAGIATNVILYADRVLIAGLRGVTYMAPEFIQLNFANYLAYGYSIDFDRILVALAITLAFCLGLLVMGYYFLKTREIAG